ncbi:MAG: formylglycine-generating enzyme family protein [Myxococcota bacterium]|nr:formylglycine-generating enzyme family protein [Myxococcota bacterium]
MTGSARFKTLGGWISLGAAVCALGCDREQEAPVSSVASAARAGSEPQATAAVAIQTVGDVTPTLTCPERMALVPGGEAWIGSDPEERFAEDESPRFLTRLASFCLDRTEVTAAAYSACVEGERCTPAAVSSPNCTGSNPERFDHPINCVDFEQAEAFCKARGARLPTEVEWEYAARGGSAALRYPWGSEPPDGHTCWKEPHTCRVGRFPADSLGIFDLSGNVWEWTSTYYGPYPWPPLESPSRVYRGGSWSRRFVKWMHIGLRNRSAPFRSGSHLGFRCALKPAGAVCPFGALPDGECRHGVVTRTCSPGYEWNGLRCAAPGAPPCAEGRHEEPGFGCVLDSARPTATRADLRAEVRKVSRARSPEFDSDCMKSQRDRPHAFRYSGGTHDARNEVGRSQGCKNRDVGVGWNSACCP